MNGAIATVGSLMSSWFSPTGLFGLLNLVVAILNLVIATILISSKLKFPHKKPPQDQNQNQSDDYNPHNSPEPRISTTESGPSISPSTDLTHLTEKPIPIPNYKSPPQNQNHTDDYNPHNSPEPRLSSTESGPLISPSIHPTHLTEKPVPIPNYKSPPQNQNQNQNQSNNYNPHNSAKLHFSSTESGPTISPPTDPTHLTESPVPIPNCMVVGVSNGDEEDDQRYYSITQLGKSGCVFNYYSIIYPQDISLKMYLM